MKNRKRIMAITAALIPAAAILAQNLATKESDTKPIPGVVLTQDIKWGALNPARGKKGPRAANLWGDRAGSGTTGFLVKFTDGFSSPPHIHNVTYRGVVISGLVHNDDPAAETMWMPAGSFWTQPAGEVHITSAKGENVVAYIEIDSGPYLVMPKEEAFDRGERPINVDPSNIVWLDQSNSTWIESSASQSAEIAHLWGNPQEGQPSGTMVKLPAGFSGTIQSPATPMRAVMIKGQLKHQLASQAKIEAIEAGNYFGSEEKTTHRISSPPNQECLLYIRAEGAFKVIAN